MGSHNGAIGLPRAERFAAAIAEMMSRADRLGGTRDGRVEVYGYQDPSGSRATVTLEERRVVCFTPTFAPATRLDVRIGSLAEEECPYERPLILEVLGDGGVEHPMAVAIEDLGVTEPVAGTEGARVEVVGLGERLTFFPDEAAYRASGTPMAVESFIPSGLFSLGSVETTTQEPFQVSARVLMSGVVTGAELRRHALFDVPFVVCRVRSYGAEWTTCLDPADLGGADAVRVPAVGSIISGTFYVTGRVLDGLRNDE